MQHALDCKTSEKMSSLLKMAFGGGGREQKSKSDHKPIDSRTQNFRISDCLRGHRACVPQDRPPFLPTRLIDVSFFPALRLINTHALRTEPVRFAALSYCWGNSMPEEGKTTLANLGARQRSIDYETLPKTLRDAIEVTRSLEIPYVWIDALCIVQDSYPDWEREAATMGQVYSNATLTIAAAASDHCDGGFLHAFRQQNPHRRSNPQPPDSDWIDTFSGNPLLRRGWTLQERELSSRIIHFTATQALWECRAARYTPCACLIQRAGSTAASTRLQRAG